MRSARPKVLHEVAGRAMVAHVVAAVQAAGADAVALVVGPGRDDVANVARSVAPSAEVFVQTDRLGTAHAVLAARAALERGYDDVLIAFADIFVHHHEHFGYDGIPGFYSFYGLFACVAMVVFSKKIIAVFLKRDDTYYDPEGGYADERGEATGDDGHGGHG